MTIHSSSSKPSSQKSMEASLSTQEKHGLSRIQHNSLRLTCFSRLFVRRTFTETDIYVDNIIEYRYILCDRIDDV